MSLRRERFLTASALCCAIALVLFSSCSAASSSGGKSGKFDGSLLRVGINADVADLGPFSSNSNGRNSLILTLYQPLADRDGVGGDLAPVIMKKYDKVDDLHYDIEIWDTVHDSAGNKITAADVAWCFQMALKNMTNPNIMYMKSMEATGDYTLKMELTTNFVGCFESVVKIPNMVSRKAYEASKDQMATTPIGTTHYKLAQFVPGASATFEMINNYWQKDPAGLAAQKFYGVANVKKITYTTIKEASQMAIGVETGTVDLGLSMDAIEAKRFMGDQSKGKYTVFEQVTNIGNQMYLSGDATSPFSKSKDLRKAVLYSIDKQGLVDGVLNGFGAVEYTFGGDSFSDFNPEWKDEDYFDYDPDMAKSLLAKSGYGGKELRIMTDNTAQRNKTAQIIQGYLRAVGINSTILQYDSALFNSYKNKPSEWDIMLDNTGSSDYLVGIWRKFDARQYKNGTQNGWKDPKLQSLLEATLSPSSHTPESMEAFHEYLKDQAYAMGLFNHTFFTVAKAGIKDIVYDARMFVYAPGVTF